MRLLAGEGIEIAYVALRQDTTKRSRYWTYYVHRQGKVHWDKRRFTLRGGAMLAAQKAGFRVVTKGPAYEVKER